MTELPKGWAVAPLDDLVSPVSHSLAIGPFGSNLKFTDYRDEGVPLVFVRNIRARDFDLVPTFVSEAKAAELVAHTVEPGDVLITKMGDPPGDTAIYPGGRGSAILTADCIKATPHPEISGGYLSLAIESPACALQVGEMTSGVAQQKVSLGKIRKLQLPVAPLAEQERIVTAIEEAFSKLDAGEAGLRTVRHLLKRMRDAVLAAAVTGRLVPQVPTETPANKLVRDLGAGTPLGAPLPSGWAWAEVGSLLTRIEAGKSFATLGRPAEANEVGVIKVSAMTWGEFRNEENKAVPASWSIDPKWVIRAGDLLFSRANTSEYVGACVLVEQDHPNLILSDKSLRLVPEHGVSSGWLLHCLRSAPARSQIEALATGTKESMRNISQAKLRSVRVALPPMEEQARIVDEIERQFSFLDACERAVDAGLVRSAAMRRSILKTAFEGRLVPQDSSDEPALVLLERIHAERAAAPNRAGPRRTA